VIFIFQGRIYHAAGSFIINSHTRKINGFEKHDLENGKNFEIVQEEVKKLLKNKIVLTVNGRSDFASLDLRMGDYNCFEFHEFWKKWTGGYSKQTNTKVYSPISLSRLYRHYFRTEIQSGEHSATEDALATVKLFREAYIPYMSELGNPYYFEKYLESDEQDDFEYIQ